MPRRSSWFEWCIDVARIAFAGSKTTTLECLQQFLADGFGVDLLLTLTPEQGTREQVAGYLDLRPFAATAGIPVVHPQSYGLRGQEDRKTLLAQSIDLLLVIGWQRLIPGWWLEALSIGAFGMHGSAEPLPRGRGRSPMNWAIAQGRTSFLTHLFRYDAGVDSGDIVAAQRFAITPWDDAATMHMKNRIAMNRLLREHLPALLARTAALRPQRRDVEPTYLPKRTSEDGRVAWNDMDMTRLHDHIRCQTRPFPGAFSHLEGDGRRFYFWRGHPFDTHLTYDTLPGTVVEVLHDASFVVAVWDGSVRIVEYEAPDGEPPRRGQRFQ